MKKTVFLGCGGVSIILMLVFAGSVKSDNHAMAATGVPYVNKEQINGGEPIKLEYWEWSAIRATYQREWAEAYMAIYPNVEIEIVLQPWATYWPSLTNNIPAGKGPAMWHMHAAKMPEYCEGELMAPIPAEVADPEYLDAHWLGFAEGAMACPGTGTLHTVPMGAMMPVLYINTDMWDAAGLTDADIPSTWAELRSVARRLTQRDGRNRITVAGLSMTPQEFLINAIYQQGRYLFGEDGNTAQVENPQYEAALQFIADLVHEDKSLDQEIIVEEQRSFATRKAAMFIGFSYTSGFIKANVPDLNWTNVAMPTPDGKVEPAYGNIRIALEAVVNSYSSAEEQAVAWDFWHFNYANEKNVLEDLALANSFLPAYDALMNNKSVTDDPVISMMSDLVDYGVINHIPQEIRDEQNELATAVVLDGSDITGLMKASQTVQNNLLAKGRNWNIIERNYANDALMIQEQ